MSFIRIHDVVVSDSERKQLLGVVDSGWISGSGPQVLEFEQALGAFLKTPQKPVSTTTGTAALILALLAAGVKKGDHVLVSAYGFIATANAVCHVGGEPVFIGPERGDYPVVTPGQVRRFLDSEVTADGKYKKTGRPLRGLLYNEPYGLACDEIASLRPLLSARDMFFVEDAAQAFGVEVGGRMLGTFGDFAAFSFNGNKTLSTGQGGALAGFSSQGLDLAFRLSSQARSDSFDFYHDPLGYNFQLSNVLAGFGLGQIARIEKTLANKCRIHRWYAEALRGT
ncbi:MAG: DegT/DnrJ/EryC1/StrS family aminotransferase, partial [Bdellovibrionota bacterium]